MFSASERGYQVNPDRSWHHQSAIEAIDYLVAVLELVARANDADIFYGTGESLKNASDAARNRVLGIPAIAYGLMRHAAAILSVPNRLAAAPVNANKVKGLQQLAAFVRKSVCIRQA